jgi:molecular chaperone GrpE
MPDFPSAAVSGSTSGSGQEALTPEVIEAVLADFRTWLQQAAVPFSAPSESEAEPIDLHTLLAQFTALRHEVNLQTRALRAQQEQSAAALDQLGDALQTLQRVQSPPRLDSSGAEETVRPLLKALVDARDSLALAEPEVRRVQDAVHPALEKLAEQAASAPSFWSRIFRTRDNSSATREAADRVRQLLESLVTGYTMSLQRLDRALVQSNLEPIPCVGESFDPELMEVVATVTDSNRAAGTVVEEVRRGYLWGGRVFRYAQVSVAKNP